MFTINGEQWDIVLVQPNDMALLMPNGDFAVGACSDVIKTIFLSDELYGEDFERVLCHELVHAAMFAYNISLSWEDEEMLAEIISIFGEEIIDLTDIIFERIAKGRH